MCRGGIPPKNCAAVIILALSSSGAKRKYFLTSAQGLLRNVTLKFHLRGWITIPRFPSKEKWNSTGWFCPPPALPLSRGRDLFSTLQKAVCRKGFVRRSPSASSCGPRKPPRAKAPRKECVKVEPRKQRRRQVDSRSAFKYSCTTSSRKLIRIRT